MKIVTNLKISIIKKWGAREDFEVKTNLNGERILSLVPSKSMHQINDTICKLKNRWTRPELLLIGHTQLVLQADNECITLHPSVAFSQYLIDTQITCGNNDIYERMGYVFDKGMISRIANAIVFNVIYIPIKRHIERYPVTQTKCNLKCLLKKHLKNNQLEPLPN